MNVFDLPTHILPYSQEWGLSSHSRVFTSAFTGYKQAQSTPGAMWECKYNYPVLRDDQARIFKAFLVKLRGQSSMFTARDFTYVGLPNSGITGTASLGAATLILSAPTDLHIGDYINVGNELKMVVADSTGTQVDIEPPFRDAHSGSAVLTFDPACNMLLDTDSVMWTAVSPRVYSLEFSGKEIFA